MAMFSSGDAIQNPYLAAAAKSEGINYVLVNGHVVIDGGNHTGNGATRARIPRSWFNDPAVKSHSTVHVQWGNCFTANLAAITECVPSEWPLQEEGVRNKNAPRCSKFWGCVGSDGCPSELPY